MERPHDSALRRTGQPGSSPSHNLCDFEQLLSLQGLSPPPLLLCWPFERKGTDRVVPELPGDLGLSNLERQGDEDCPPRTHTGRRVFPEEWVGSGRTFMNLVLEKLSNREQNPVWLLWSLRS